jgi:twitching motility protein PilT
MGSPTAPVTGGTAAAVSQPASSLDLKAVLQEMVRRQASDLHLKVGRPPTLRVNGELVSLDAPALRADELTGLAERVMTAHQGEQFRAQKEADFSIGLPGVGRFRVNVYLQRGSLCFAMRAIPYEVPTLEELRLPPVLGDIALRPRGLVLVTGGTGSGKSTALAAMVQHINRHRRANVITIEDPIEFLHRELHCHISQREVGSDTESFEQALRRVLRQDPDVILIGEIRDLDTLDTALKAADTGHLVLTTLHTTDAAHTLHRVLSFYPPHQQAEVRASLASALQAVVSLRLVPRADGQGRVPATEVLINTAAVRDQILDRSSSLDIPELIRDGALQYGMQSFDQSLMAWYTQGVIAYESALSHATNPGEFALRVQGVSATSDSSWSGFETRRS